MFPTSRFRPKAPLQLPNTCFGRSTSMGKTDLSVRPAGSSDVPGIDRVLHASYSVLLRGVYQDEELDAFLPHIVNTDQKLLESGRLFVATDDQGTVVACGGWSSVGPDSGDTEELEGLSHLRQFAVHPGWAGRGLGKSIFEAIQMQGREVGVLDFDCCSSLLAEGFYARLGLQTVGVKEVHVKDGVPPIQCKLMTTRSDVAA